MTRKGAWFRRGVRSRLMVRVSICLIWTDDTWYRWYAYLRAATTPTAYLGPRLLYAILSLPRFSREFLDYSLLASIVNTNIPRLCISVTILTLHASHTPYPSPSSISLHLLLILHLPPYILYIHIYAHVYHTAAHRVHKICVYL